MGVFTDAYLRRPLAPSTTKKRDALPADIIGEALDQAQVLATQIADQLVSKRRRELGALKLKLRD